jgi:hypothetical protein
MKNDRRIDNQQAKLDNVLERGKKFLDFMSSNLYESNLKLTQTKDLKGNLYSNPFSTVKKEDHEHMDTLDRIELLEYSQELSNHKQNEMKDSISISNESNFNNIGSNTVNIKDYDNFILKIEDLSILDQKVFADTKQNLTYIECKVPLFKADEMSLFYDTFKYKLIINNIEYSTKVTQINYN